MPSCLFVVNELKDGARELSLELADWLERRGVTLLSDPARTGVALPGKGHPDFVLVLGGDGTLLTAARNFAASGAPLMGINLGQLGFLTTVEQKDMYEGLERLLAGDYRVEERMMLQARVCRQGCQVGDFIGLNDVVITKGAFSRIINLKTYVGGHHVENYPADGLIVSTSTGSTAYSLSAGGPIVSPELEVLVLTPICPHTLYARPLVISPRDEVKVSLNAGRSEVMLTVDGQSGFSLEDGDEISIGRAPHPAHLIQLAGRSFFKVLREKLREGQRGNE